MIRNTCYYLGTQLGGGVTNYDYNLDCFCIIEFVFIIKWQVPYSHDQKLVLLFGNSALRLWYQLGLYVTKHDMILLEYCSWKLKITLM